MTNYWTDWSYRGLAELLSDRSHDAPTTIKLLFLAAEEEGGLGSWHYAQNMPADGSHVVGRGRNRPCSGGRVARGRASEPTGMRLKVGVMGGASGELTRDVLDRALALGRAIVVRRHYAPPPPRLGKSGPRCVPLQNTYEDLPGLGGDETRTEWAWSTST